MASINESPKDVKLKIVLIFFLSASLPVQASTPQTPTTRELVNRFCNLEATGRELNANGFKEFANELLLKEHPWLQPTAVWVIRDCSIREMHVQKDKAEISIDYRVLGSIDSGLRLIRLQTPYTGETLIQSEHLSLVLTDTHFQLTADGQLQPIRGLIEWRIKSYPTTPHISIFAAMQHVRNMMHHSKDPFAKLNAEKTLSEFQNLEMSSMAPTTSNVQQSPQDVLSQFIEMQMDGAVLTADRSNQIQLFFAHPVQWSHEKIGITRAYVVKNTSFSGKNAVAVVEYSALGELDPQFRFVSKGANGIVIQQDYKLVLDNKYSAPARGNYPAQEFTGPTRWRIEEAPSEQWISVSTAIDYVMQIRDSTADPAIKANAEKTLAILKP